MFRIGVDRVSAIDCEGIYLIEKKSLITQTLDGIGF